MTVLDASICLPWFLPDEAQDAADRAKTIVLSGTAMVPPIWHIEMANVLVMAARRGRLTDAGLDVATGLLSEVPVEVDLEFRLGETVELARRHGLTVYDATYLELAVRRRLPLATLDSKLARAAVAEGVETLA